MDGEGIQPKEDETLTGDLLTREHKFSIGVLGALFLASAIVIVIYGINVKDGWTQTVLPLAVSFLVGAVFGVYEVVGSAFKARRQSEKLQMKKAKELRAGLEAEQRARIMDRLDRLAGGAQ